MKLSEKAKLLELCSPYMDPDKVPNWQYKTFSPNSDVVPPVYVESREEAEDFYIYYLVWTSSNIAHTRGIKFRIETRDGRDIEHGTWCG